MTKIHRTSTAGILYVLTLAALFVLAFDTAAFATVRPPDEWFAESSSHMKLWQDTFPILNRLEFGDRAEKLVPDDEIYQVVSDNYGATDLSGAKVSVDKGREFFNYDRNLDGRLDYRDVLELGYELPVGRKPSAALSFGTAKWIVLRTDFPDSLANYATYNVAYFYDRFFSDGTAPKPSCNDYYKQVSFNKFNITGTIDDNGPHSGWYQASHNRVYYKSWNKPIELVTETVLAADPYVDYSKFDVDGDGYVDTLIVFYNDAEFVAGLWPHRSSGLNIHVDGVVVDAYFLTGYSTSNDSWTMTISSHEYGHILGLPDLYDTDYSSNGIGVWDLMSNQYDNNQKIPSPSAWCRTQLGWITPTNIEQNYATYSLKDIHDAGDALRIWTNGQQGQEYFLLENRRKVQTDATRPGEGVLIWHIDDTKSGGNADNVDEMHKHVDLEVARGQDVNGKDALDRRDDNGNPNDPYFSGNSAAGYTNTFSVSSNPNTKDYAGNDTQVVVDGFSAIGDPETFNITVLTATRPTAAITAPANGANVSGQITFSATATATGIRTIAGVKFYANNRLVGEDATEPYSITWETHNTYNGPIEIKVVATDSAGEVGYAKRNITVSNTGIAVPYTDTITSGMNWSILDGGGTATWRYYTADFSSPSASMGIGPNYGYNEEDYLCSVRLDLTGATHPILRFKQKYRISSGENFATVFVTADNGATLVPLATYNGTQMLQWQSKFVDLLPYAGSDVYILFMLNSTSLNNGPSGGWWIDDFTVKELSAGPVIQNITPASGSTISGTTPINVTTSDDEAIDRVEYYVRDFLTFTDSTAPYSFAFNSLWMFNGDQGVKVKVYDSDGQFVEQSLTYTVDNVVQSEPLLDGFESGLTNWYILDYGGLGTWHTLTNRTYDGSNALFCGMGTSGYDDNENDYAFSPTVSLAGISNPRLMFARWVRTEPSYDYAKVYAYTDFGTSTLLGSWSVLDSAWTLENIDLSAFAGDDEVKIAFQLNSDGGLTYQGFWVDYFAVLDKPIVSSCDPPSGRVNIGSVFKLLGSGFGGPVSGSSITIPTTTGSFAIPSSSCSLWTSGEIDFVVPDGAAPGGNITVTRHSLTSVWNSFTPVLPPPTIGEVHQY